jgi:hypothetical protein
MNVEYEHICIVRKKTRLALNVFSNDILFFRIFFLCFEFSIFFIFFLNLYGLHKCQYVTNMCKYEHILHYVLDVLRILNVHFFGIFKILIRLNT